MNHVKMGLLVSMAVLLAACSDVGDDINVPGSQESGQDATAAGEAGGQDATQPEDGSGESSAQDGFSGDGPTGDATMDPDAVTGGEDSGEPDSPGAMPDAGPDAPSTTPDAGPDAPSTTPDAGPDGSTGSPDAGPDATVGAGDAGPRDSGSNDANVASDAPPGASACTTPPCASTGPNSVLCNGNAASDAGVCTPTEAIFVQHDIDKGLLNDAGQLSIGNFAMSPHESCYECLLAQQCFDDALGDYGQECGDVAASAPTLNNENGPAACLDTLHCMLDNRCAGVAPLTCYCGTVADSTCVSTGGANGPCVSEETNGLDTTVPSMINTAFGNAALPAGMANTLFACAIANGCGNCLPAADGGI
jgi:hypothetical protein